MIIRLTAGLQFLLFFVTCSQAQAGGNEVGNGGNVLVCRAADGIQNYELFDFFETRLLRALEPELGDKLTVEGKIDYVLNRLSRLDLERAEKYRKEADSFFRNANFFKNVTLPSPGDIGNVLIPDHCSVKQAAVQKEPKFPEDKRYLIDERIWEKLDATDRAGLILHEVIYRDVAGAEFGTSIYVRYFTSVLCSDVLATYSQESYRAMIQSLFLDGVPYSDSVNQQVFVYYPDLRLTFEEAAVFCEKYPGRSRLAYSSDLTLNQLHWGSIGKHILGEDGEGVATIWTQNRETKLPEAWLFASESKLTETDETERLPFICRIESRRR